MPRDREKRLVLVFVKHPESESVKTRLAEGIGEKAARELYKCFVSDFVDTLKRGSHPFKICFHPPAAAARIKEWLGHEYSYVPQEGGNIGVKMKNAFISVFNKGASKALLIGSDIPDLTNALIDEAFESLKADDAVVGPAFDGGYYLIGFRRETFLPGVFSGMSWGTRRIFDETMKVFDENGYSVHKLPQWSDVDTVDDLKRLHRDTEFSKSRTMRKLQALLLPSYMEETVPK